MDRFYGNEQCCASPTLASLFLPLVLMEASYFWLTELSELVSLTRVLIRFSLFLFNPWNVICLFFHYFVFRILWMVPIYATDSVCISYLPSAVNMFLPLGFGPKKYKRYIVDIAWHR